MRKGQERDRRTYIGSSDAAAILGVSPWATAYQVWQRKVAPTTVVEEENPAMKRGRRLEPVVFEMLADEMPELKVFARNTRHTDPRAPYLSTELDGEATLREETVNVEVKTVHPRNAYQWGEEGTDEIPIWYAVQILHAQMVTGRRTTIVAALIGADDLRKYRIERDDAIVRDLRAREVAFWKEHVLANVPPPLAALADVNAMYAREKTPSVVATGDVIDAVVRLGELKRHAKEIEEKIAEEEKAIKMAMKDAALLVDAQGKRLISWKTTVREVFDQRAFMEQNPGLAASFRKTIATRTFRVA